MSANQRAINAELRSGYPQLERAGEQREFEQIIR